uniref:Membrane palmitoylated protein 2 n=1 Tax=Petromyzon marinus TaxID=7757 RepID=S4RTA4_PETMA
MEQVLKTLPDMPRTASAKETDLIFLKGLMESPVVQCLAKAQGKLEEPKLEAVSENNLELVKEILEDISPMTERDNSAAELATILQEPHFQSLLGAHDSVASKSYECLPCSPHLNADSGDELGALESGVTDAIRMVGIRKMEGEPLGVTFRVESNELVIARILRGGMIDQQGLLHVGDVIREVNGCDVSNDPYLREATGSVVLKILPSYTLPQNPAPVRTDRYPLHHVCQQLFVKCQFDYNPADDQLIPCKEAGLKFSQGDVLQIVSQDDPDWWQACKAQDGGSAGLVPSQTLEEKRKAYVRQEMNFTSASGGALCGVLGGKKKKKLMYMSTKNAEFDRHEILIYEEMAKMPPFQRKTLVLIGAQGVGRRSLKNRLLVSEPSRYGMTIPFTSRRPRDDEKDGQGYHFVARADMEVDIKSGRYLESGEYEGNLYGTKIESIGVVRAGKMCILDVNPQALKLLRTAEFMPYVVFIAAPSVEILRSMHKAALDAGLTAKHLTDADLKKTVDESTRIQRAYIHYFDLTIVNDNMDEAFANLRAYLERLVKEPQWVPIGWVY